MNVFVAIVKVAARKWSQTKTSSWAVAAGILLVAIGLFAGIQDQFEHKGAVVIICIGVFVVAVAAITKAIQNGRRRDGFTVSAAREGNSWQEGR